MIYNRPRHRFQKMYILNKKDIQIIMCFMFIVAINIAIYVQIVKHGYTHITY